MLVAHERELGGLAYAVLQDQAAARQVVAEALASAIRDEWPAEAAAVRRRALAAAARILAHRASRRGGVDPVLPPLVPGAEPMIDGLTPGQLHAALATLPPRRRVLLALHHVAGLGNAELAEAVGRRSTSVLRELAAAHASLEEATGRLSSWQTDIEEIDGP